MKLSRILFCIAAAVLVMSGAAHAKSLLEKPIFWINAKTGKVDSCKYWKIFIGKYDAVTLVRKFPGEDSLPVNSDVNLTVMSSGYIEGSGYSAKGRVDCTATFVIDTGAGTVKLPVDSIEYIFAGGAKVKPRGGRVCDLAIDVEGNKVPGVKQMLLTKYKLTVDADERNLKPLEDVALTYFSFSKSSFAAAQKAEKEAAAAPAPSK